MRELEAGGAGDDDGDDARAASRPRARSRARPAPISPFKRAATRTTLTNQPKQPPATANNRPACSRTPTSRSRGASAPRWCARATASRQSTRRRENAQRGAAAPPPRGRLSPFLPWSEIESTYRPFSKTGKLEHSAPGDSLTAVPLVLFGATHLLPPPSPLRLCAAGGGVPPIALN